MYDSLFYRKYEANKKKVHALVHNPTYEFCEHNIFRAALIVSNLPALGSDENMNALN